MPNRMIKFTQVAVAGDGENAADVYALDEFGRVWFLRRLHGWVKLPNPTEADLLSPTKEQSNGEERPNT